MTATALEILKTVYGYDAFRGPQAGIVEHVIGGNNAFVHRMPGRLKYQNVTLTRAVDRDSGNLARSSSRKSSTSLPWKAASVRSVISASAGTNGSAW